jgi:type I restriction enzyme M protein
VEVIEPYHGRLLDPFSGSGGMYVQSAAFLERHKQNPSALIVLYGQEKVAETVRLCRMNLAVHGLSGEIKPCITRDEIWSMLRADLLFKEVTVKVVCHH